MWVVLEGVCVEFGGDVVLLVVVCIVALFVWGFWFVVAGTLLGRVDGFLFVGGIRGLVGRVGFEWGLLVCAGGSRVVLSSALVFGQRVLHFGWFAGERCVLIEIFNALIVPASEAVFSVALGA